MNGYDTQHALNRYQQLGVEAEIGDASPHRLIAMMLQGALSRVLAARGALEAGQTARKGELIGRAISLLEGLAVSLDRERGGEIAVNLAALYDYASRRLLQANAANDAAMLTEVAGLIRQISDAWAAIASQAPGSVQHAGR